MKSAVLALLTALALLAQGPSTLRLQPDQLFKCAPNAKLKQCKGDTGPTSNCDGLFYVDIFTASGTTYKIVGTLANTTDVSGPNWTDVP